MGSGSMWEANRQLSIADSLLKKKKRNIGFSVCMYFCQAIATDINILEMAIWESLKTVYSF